MDLAKIASGTKVEYGFFRNLTFKGTDDNHVILEDKNGNVKKVLKVLFERHGKVIS